VTGRLLGTDKARCSPRPAQADDAGIRHDPRLLGEQPPEGDLPGCGVLGLSQAGGVID
jgi:hypothetical protein